MTTEVISVGDELGIILPAEALRHLNLGPGATVHITMQSNSIHLAAEEP